MVWLLSMTRQDALDIDSSQRDSCAGLAAADEGGETTADSPALPTVVRWHDVQQAKRSVIHDKQSLHVLQLRAQGFSERELERITEGQRIAMRRRWHATVDDILAKLGGAQELPAEDNAIAAACVSCGRRPRVRLVAVGAGIERDAARTASTCAQCLTPDLHHRVAESGSPMMGELAVAA